MTSVKFTYTFLHFRPLPLYCHAIVCVCFRVSMCASVSSFGLIKGNLPWRVGASQSGLLKDRQPINNTRASTPTYTHYCHPLRCTHTYAHTHTHLILTPWKQSPSAAPKPGDHHSHLPWNKGCEILAVITAPLSALPACLCREAALSSIAQSFIRLFFFF